MREGTCRHHIKKAIMRLKKTIKLLVPPIIPQLIRRKRKAPKISLEEGLKETIAYFKTKTFKYNR